MGFVRAQSLLQKGVSPAHELFPLFLGLYINLKKGYLKISILQNDIILRDEKLDNPLPRYISLYKHTIFFLGSNVHCESASCFRATLILLNTLTCSWTLGRISGVTVHRCGGSPRKTNKHTNLVVDVRKPYYFRSFSPLLFVRLCIPIYLFIDACPFYKCLRVPLASLAFLFSFPLSTSVSNYPSTQSNLFPILICYFLIPMENSFRKLV